ncbi:MAG TPA: hypothetical protein VM242_15745 [Acidimicrobiales bacterium]|nr:hypothetical protein [Acidimicrobiales bacterium]
MGLFSFLDPIFGGGGGGASSSVTSTMNLNVNGLDKMSSTVEVKPLELKPLTFNEVIEVKPLELKPLTVNETLELKPVTLNETVELKPVTVNETFDLRPVAIDSCQTMRLAPLPETRVCQPYRHHVAYTMFGVEWAGVTYDGESQQNIESPRRPQVVESPELSPRRRRRHPAKVVGGGGLRVRVVDPDGDDGDGE